jgi:hypothetical protein
VRLKNIPWRDALDASVKTLGFVVVEEERGILRVVPASNIQQDLETEDDPAALRAAELDLCAVHHLGVHRDKRQAAAAKGEINFTLLDTLEGMITPEVGTSSTSRRPTSIMVKDTKPGRRETCKKTDRDDRCRAVADPARRAFVTTSNEDVLDFGISPGGSGYTASSASARSRRACRSTSAPAAGTTHLIANDTGTGPFADDNPELHRQARRSRRGVRRPQLQQVTATLRLLKKDARSEIVQAPQIVAWTTRRRRSSSARRSATPRRASSRARPVACCWRSRRATSRRSTSASSCWRPRTSCPAPTR